MNSKLLIFLLLFLPIIGLGQGGARYIKPQRILSDTITVSKHLYTPALPSSIKLDSVLTRSANGEVVIMRNIGGGFGLVDTLWVITVDTIWYDCDTTHLDSITRCSSDTALMDTVCIFYPERDSLHDCSFYLDYDTTYVVNNYSYSPWLRDSIQQVVYLKSITDKVAIGTVSPTTELDVNGDGRFRQGIYIHGGSGDANGDGVITPADVTVIRRYIRNKGSDIHDLVDYPDAQKAAMDVTGDGMISMADEDALRFMIATYGSVDVYTYPDSSKRLQGTVLYRLLSGATVIGSGHTIEGGVVGSVDKFNVEMNGSVRITANDPVYFGGNRDGTGDSTTIALYKSRKNLLSLNGSEMVKDTLFAQGKIRMPNLNTDATHDTILSLVNGEVQATAFNELVDGTVESVGLVGSTGIQVDGSPITESGTMTITNTLPEATTVANVGTGEGDVYRDMTGNQINLKTIKQGTGITVTNNTDDVTVTNSSPDQVITLAGAGITTVTGTYPGTFTITSIEVDGSVTNERDSVFADYMGKITGRSDEWIRNDTVKVDTSFARVYGAGINVVTGTYPNYTVTGTEVDGSITNEIQALSVSGTSSPTVTLSKSGGDFTLVGDGSTSLSVSNDTITINTPIPDSLIPQGLNSVMAIDSSTDHMYISYYSGYRASMHLLNYLGVPAISFVHTDETATTKDSSIMALWGGGSTGYWNGLYKHKYNHITKASDSVKDIQYAYKKVRIQGFASQDWSTTANGTYMTFNTTANDSTTDREAMRITQDKRVAIGTTSPTAQLTVAKTVHFDAPGRAVTFDSVYVKDLSTGDIKTAHKSQMGRDSTYIKSGTAIRVDSSGNTYTINNISPDSTTLTGLGTNISVLEPTANHYTIRVTESDSSVTNERDSLFRYSVYSSGNNNVEVLATARGITASLAGSQFTFTIPANVRILSAKVRVENFSSLTFIMGTSDMGNSSMADRWMPIVQGWREDNGQQLGALTTIMDLSTFTKFTVNGLNNTTKCQVRLSF